jgi:hypothetical protein
MLRPYHRPWVASAGAPISVSFRRARGARRLAHPPRAALLADPYDVLGVKSDAAPEEIKLAYRKRTKALHPDVNPSPNAAEAFRRVNRAYAVVSDKARRARFDLGRDLEARDDGFAPDGETRRRAARARYGSAIGDDAGPSDGYWDEVGSFGVSKTNASATTHDRRSNPFGVVADDEELRAKGERVAMWNKARDAWTKWCSAWFVVLTLAVPLGTAYWAAYAIAARLTPGGGVPILER